MSKKKKLLYVVRYPLDEGFHLKQKFDGQLDAFAALGYDVYFIGYDKQYFYLINEDNRQTIGKTHFEIPNYFHTFLYVNLYNKAKKVIVDEKIDVVYYRLSAKFMSLYSLVREIKRNDVKFIFEIPTYLPNKQEKALSLPRKLFELYSNIWGNRIMTLPDLYVFMGDEHFTTFNGTKAIRIENGIAPGLMPLRTPVCQDDTVNILALSSMCDWHGYDRLIKSLREYDGSEDVIIHMVGGNDGGRLTEWKNLAENLGLREKVIFHGPLYGKKLDEIFDLCDIGVNSMGMYRKGMTDTSELKTREYMARGLPFVSSVNDVVLDGLDKELFYMISNDETIPDMGGIVEFAIKMRQDKTVPKRLRDHAINTMTWEAQYRKVFDRLEE